MAVALKDGLEGAAVSQTFIPAASASAKTRPKMECPSSNDLEQPRWFWSGLLGLIGFRLCCLTLMVQAAVLDGLLFDASSFGQDGFAATKVDICRGQVADAFVIAFVVVVADEGGDGGFAFVLHEVVFQ